MGPEANRALRAIDCLQSIMLCLKRLRSVELRIDALQSSIEFPYIRCARFLYFEDKTGEGNRTPVIFFFKNMVLPLNYAHSRGYGVSGSFLSKRLNLNS